jgi:hypothetical protein
LLPKRARRDLAPAVQDYLRRIGHHGDLVGATVVWIRYGDDRQPVAAALTREEVQPREWLVG